MRIGVAKEIKPQEYRVALTPAGARELVQRGHEVVVEAGAGIGSAFPDEAYERAGAALASVDDVWGSADLLLKVKEPIASEYPRLREGLTLFTYLHIAADEPLTRALVDSGITAIAYETVETDRGALPLLAPMSEIAGRLAAQAGADQLEKPKGGRGILLGGVAGVAPGARARDRRRDGRLQRSRDRARHGSPGDDPGALRRPHALPRADPVRSRAAPHVVRAPARGVDQGRGSHDRRRPHPGRARAEARHARDAADDEGELGLRRRRDRPGRLRRDVEADDARRPRVHGRRRHSLLRREHAGRSPDHVDPRADERHASRTSSSSRISVHSARCPRTPTWRGA